MIDFVSELYDLSPLDAVRRLDADFHLRLPLGKPPDIATLKVAQRRKEISDTFQAFERWKADMLQQLTACFRLAHLTMKAIETPMDLNRLTDAQASAIRQQARLEWLAAILTSGAMAEKMEVFRQRKGVTAICEKILSNSQTRSGVV